MGAGWIAQGQDTPAPTGTAPDPWTPTGPDTGAVPPLAKPKAPADTSRGLLTQGKELLFGHEPESPSAPDQHYTTGILPSIGESLGNDVDAVTDWAKNRALAPGPEASTLLKAYPHLVGAEMSKVGAGYQETYGAKQVQNAERQLAGYNVLPQVAARLQTRPGAIVPIEQMAKDPLVEKTARSL